MSVSMAKLIYVSFLKNKVKFDFGLNDTIIRLNLGPRALAMTWH